MSRTLCVPRIDFLMKIILFVYKHCLVLSTLFPTSKNKAWISEFQPPDVKIFCICIKPLETIVFACITTMWGMPCQSSARQIDPLVFRCCINETFCQIFKLPQTINYDHVKDACTDSLEVSWVESFLKCRLTLIFKPLGRYHFWRTICPRGI